MFKAIIAVIIGAVVVLVVFSNIDKSTSDSSTTTTEVSDSSKLSLTITGEVTKTGTYYITSGGTLGDLITAAGGATSNADSKAYNSTYVLKNNQSFYIAPIYNTADTCSQVEIEKVNINEADSETLQTLSGVKSALATSILSYRSSNGDFQRIEDLKEVDGIGSTIFLKLRDYVTLK